MEIGLQVFSVRQAFQQDRRGTMAKIAEIGYRHVEMPLDFSGLDLFEMSELKAEELKSITTENGLKLMAIHMFLTEDAQLDDFLAYNEILECQKAVIPIAFFKNEAEVLAFADKCNRYGERLKAMGVQLYYHNHFHEFQRFHGTSAFDLIRLNTEPDLLKFELDTYWAMRAGVDVFALMAQLGERCGLLHQKDMPHDLSPVNIFEMIDERCEIDIPTFQLFGGADHFTEIGSGQMDIASIVRAAGGLPDMPYLIVEQDATHRDELESVAISYRALSKYMAENEV